MLDRRLRGRPSIKTTLGQRLVFAGQRLGRQLNTAQSHTSDCLRNHSPTQVPLG